MLKSYELTLAAESDMRGIVRYTRKHYGTEQMRIYADKIRSCASQLAAGKHKIREMRGIHENLRMIHCQRHYIFGLVRHGMPLLIIAFFHEQMDVMQRLKDRIQ